MLRSGAARGVLRSLNTTSTPTTSRLASAPIRQQLRSQLCTVSRRPTVTAFAKPLAPSTTALARWKADRPPMDKIDKKREEAIQEKKIPVTPDTVSATSSVISTTDNTGDPAQHADEPDMMAGIRSDIVRSLSSDIFGLSC